MRYWILAIISTLVMLAVQDEFGAWGVPSIDFLYLSVIFILLILASIKKPALSLLLAPLFIYKTMLVYQSVPSIDTAIVNANARIKTISSTQLPNQYAQVILLENITRTQTAQHYDNPFWQDNLVPIQHNPLPQKLTVLVSDDKARLAPFAVGTRLNVSVRLSPLPKDSYGRYLKAQHIDAKAVLLTLENHHINNKSNYIDNMRLGFRRAFIEMAQSKQAQSQQKGDLSQNSRFEYEYRRAYAIVLSLLTGDRALIDHETTRLYQNVGISHILAISGAHVLWLASLVSMLALGVCRRLSPNTFLYLPAPYLRWAIMLMAATAYALFAGLEVPALRTLLFLLVAGLWRMAWLPKSSAPLVLVALIMVWVDVWVVWQAGFWLSFVAAYFMSKIADDGNLIGAIKAQLWIFLTMLPLSLYLFGAVSWWGVLVNLFAVPWFGLVIVPLDLLAGLVYFITPSVSVLIWQFLAWQLLHAHTLLDMLAQADAWQFAPSLALFLLMGACAVPFVLPKGMAPLYVKAFAPMALALALWLPPKKYALYAPVKGAAVYQDGAAAALFLWADISNKDARALVGVMRAQKVRYLTSIVALQDDKRLDDKMDMIASNIPTHKRLSARTSHSKNPSALYVNACTPQKWQAMGAQFEVVVGYGDMAKSLADCAVMITPKTIPIIELNVQKHRSTPPQAILLDGAGEAWQLHAMLCQNQLPTLLWVAPSKLQNRDMLAVWQSQLD